MDSRADQLVVGLGNLDYPPYYYQKDKKLTGLSVEITREVAKTLGHTLVFQRFPWKRVQGFLKTGKIHMVTLYFKTPDREKDVIYTSTPISFEPSEFFVLKKSDIKFDGNLKKLKNLSFGNVAGYSHGEEYNNATYIKKTEVINEKALIKMLIAKRIAIAVGNRPTIGTVRSARWHF